MKYCKSMTLKEENAERLQAMEDIKFSHAFHNLSTAEHCRRVHMAAKAFKKAGGHDVRIAAMAHDWGKVETFDPAGGEPGKNWFRGHEKKSAEILHNLGGHPMDVGLVREHGSVRQVGLMKAKTALKVLRRIYEGSEPVVGGNPLSEQATLGKFMTLLECDAMAFSDEGRRLARNQSFLFCLKALWAIDHWSGQKFVFGGREPGLHVEMFGGLHPNHIKLTRKWLAINKLISLSIHDI
jgi:hypothetical protein